MKFIWTATLPALLLLSCNKEPGEGGKAEIRGRLMEQRMSLSNNPIGDPYPLAGENIYIVYGDASEGTFPDDNVDSGPNGEFRFKWLRKGSYTVYAISECNDCGGGTQAIIFKAEIGDKKEVITTGDLTVFNY